MVRGSVSGNSFAFTTHKSKIFTWLLLCSIRKVTEGYIGSVAVWAHVIFRAERIRNLADHRVHVYVRCKHTSYRYMNIFPTWNIFHRWNLYFLKSQCFSNTIIKKTFSNSFQPLVCCEQSIRQSAALDCSALTCFFFLPFFLNIFFDVFFWARGGQTRGIGALHCSVFNHPRFTPLHAPPISCIHSFAKHIRFWQISVIVEQFLRTQFEIFLFIFIFEIAWCRL